MKIDWTIVGQAIWSVVILIVGGYLNRWFEGGTRLIVHYGHVASCLVNPPGGQSVRVNTHSIVLQNAGRKAATNVRVRQAVETDYDIYPATNHNIQHLPNGAGREIVIPNLAKDEQITISYIYFAPLTYGQLNQSVKSDEGMAKVIPVLLQRQYSKLFSIFAASLLFLGAITLLYLLYEAGRAALKLAAVASY